MTAWSLSLSGPAAHTPLVHAFGSFHPRYYTMRYDTPDATALARRVAGSPGRRVAESPGRRVAGSPEPCRTVNRSTSTPA
ncbi:hypothetical protein [Streptomyces sp. NPDC012616]|uniref:hypothetical protein n=1 Tax=Streptomyces sp. NPDC012616 TaxID=3364840 RepID=UPI0036EBF96D